MWRGSPKPKRAECAASGVLPRPEICWRGFAEGTVRTAALIEAQPAAALPQIAAAIAHGIAAYRRTDGFAVPVAAILGSGVRS